jgi:hypothetical protein
VTEKLDVLGSEPVALFPFFDKHVEHKIIRSGADDVDSGCGRHAFAKDVAFQSGYACGFSDSGFANPHAIAKASYAFRHSSLSSAI